MPGGVGGAGTVRCPPIPIAIEMTMIYVCEKRGFDILVTPSEGPAFVFINISRLKWVRWLYNLLISDIGFSYVAEVNEQKIRISSNLISHKLFNDSKAICIAKIRRDPEFQVKLLTGERIRFRRNVNRDTEIMYRENKIGIIRVGRNSMPSKCELHTDKLQHELLIPLIAVAVLRVAA